MPIDAGEMQDAGLLCFFAYADVKLLETSHVFVQWPIECVHFSYV